MKSVRIAHGDCRHMPLRRTPACGLYLPHTIIVHIHTYSGSALEDEKRPILRYPCDRAGHRRDARRACPGARRTREGAPHAIIVHISTNCIKARLVLSSVLGVQSLQLTNEHTKLTIPWYARVHTIRTAHAVNRAQTATTSAFDLSDCTASPAARG